MVDHANCIPEGVTLMLEPASKVASHFVKPCGPEEACQMHCLGLQLLRQLAASPRFAASACTQL